MNTDEAWEAWGREDPYFGVITDEKFRKGNLTGATRDEFFRSGELHVDYVHAAVQLYLGVDKRPDRILDFGCGVGRLAIPFARDATEVVAMDVSPSMLAEAKRNCEERSITNVTFALADDELSKVEGGFDLIHSILVFQHIPVERGRSILQRLLSRLNPGGVGVMDVTFAKTWFADSFGVEPQAEPTLGDALIKLTPFARSSRRGRTKAGEPEMQMNAYNLSEIFFMLSAANVINIHARLLNHGGEIGVLLFFQVPPQVRP